MENPELLEGGVNMDKNIFEGMKENFSCEKDDVRKYLNYNGQTAFIPV